MKTIVTITEKERKDILKGIQIENSNLGNRTIGIKDHLISLNPENYLGAPDSLTYNIENIFDSEDLKILEDYLEYFNERREIFEGDFDFEDWDNSDANGSAIENEMDELVDELSKLMESMINTIHQEGLKLGIDNETLKEYKQSAKEVFRTMLMDTISSNI